MKLFCFYPESFARQYVIAESMEDLLSKTDELFQKFMETSRPWMVEFPGFEDDVAGHKTFFVQEIGKAFETDLTFIDSHY